ncbi:MAG: hypothetical protein HPY57_15445 [Ignavibacteria bacterium]|nr:hypothetical protein [Ignavibacteria bacterium]
MSDNLFEVNNVRQMKNIVEQISIIEQEREIDANTLKKYLPDAFLNKLPAIVNHDFIDQKTFNTEREILFQILFDMRKDMAELKQRVHNLMHESSAAPISQIHKENIITKPDINLADNIQDTFIIEDETFSLQEKEKEMIKKALEKYNGKRKLAAQELGISERTLYRKIKEYEL